MPQLSSEICRCFYAEVLESAFGRWRSILCLGQQTLVNSMPQDWKVFTLQSPNESDIKSKLVGNPSRKSISKLWTSFTSWLAHVKTALSQLEIPIPEDWNTATDELTVTLDAAKEVVGAAAACNVIYNTSKDASTIDELKDGKLQRANY